MNVLPLIVLIFTASLMQDASESRRSKDPKAAEIFRKASAAQVEGGKAPTIRDFQAELEVTIHDTDPKTKERSRRSANVIQFYVDRGAEKPLFRRQLTEKVQGTKTVQGYDGNGYWQKLGDTPARGLAGRESKDEVARIRNEMNRTQDYLRFLFLANFEGPDVTFEYGGKNKIKANGIDREVEVVVRKKPREAPIELFIGEASVGPPKPGEAKAPPIPVLFGFSRMMESGKTEEIAFSVHRVVKSGGITALVPLVAEYREDGVLTFEARVPEHLPLKFNTNLEKELFAIPR
jgi:hypothetical protein